MNLSAQNLQIARFPFLGTRMNGESFEYLLMEISLNTAVIAIFPWMLNRVALDLNEKVDLFIPSELSLEYHYKQYSPSVITSHKNEGQNHYYEVNFSNGAPLTGSEKWSFEKFVFDIPAKLPLHEMLIRLVKDSLILKQGILVYLKHLSPYFSRIVDYPQKDYASLQKFLFQDTSQFILENEKKLNILYKSLKETLKNTNDISIMLNLEEFREYIESEISMDLFLLSFYKSIDNQKLFDSLNNTHDLNIDDPNYKYVSYIVSIKELEKRLYANYNQIVLIYIKSI